MLNGKQIYVWKELEVHSEDVVALLTFASNEDEARRLAAQRLHENFHVDPEDADEMLAMEPDIWHTDTDPVFEIGHFLVVQSSDAPAF